MRCIVSLPIHQKGNMMVLNFVTSEIYLLWTTKGERDIRSKCIWVSRDNCTQNGKPSLLIPRVMNKNESESVLFRGSEFSKQQESWRPMLCRSPHCASLPPFRRYRFHWYIPTVRYTTMLKPLNKKLSLSSPKTGKLSLILYSPQLRCIFPSTSIYI